MWNVRPLSIPAAGVMISLSVARSRVNVAATPSIVTLVTLSPRKSSENSDRSCVAFCVTSVLDVIAFDTGS